MATHTKALAQSQPPSQLTIKELAAQALKAQGLGGRLYFTQRLAGLSAKQSPRYGYAFYLPQGGLIVNVTHLVGDLLGTMPKAIEGEHKSKLFVISTLEGAVIVSLVSEAVWPHSPQSRLFAINL